MTPVLLAVHKDRRRIITKDGRIQNSWYFTGSIIHSSAKSAFVMKRSHIALILLESTIKYFILLFCLIVLSGYVNATDYVGAQSCKTCHESEYQQWQGSHHDMSMKHADTSSVLGNFNNQSLGRNRFFKKQDEYWVNIKGPDGKFQDYQIEYTFGYDPLQQYMVEFDDGRVQLIPFAWDTRTEAEGGQRWFDLYPEMTSTHQEFYWTNVGQNWNFMCADCHSTNVVKNYDLQSNSYNTMFSEINVACESCHGPASDHIAWADDPAPGSDDMGFDRDLSTSVARWLDKKDGSGILKPEKIEHSQQVLMCAQCHSRRTQISYKDHVKSNSFADRYMLDLMSGVNYFADGQVYNENFVYGSFLQSKMAQSGVTCTNCHNPHTAELRMPVETVCLQCHQADTYNVVEHHKHPIGTEAAQCVSCHMPETTYMEIDARRDHGFHIPRPDLAKQFGTPDTCLSCHQNKDSDWSSKHVDIWYKDSKTKEEKDFVPAFAATVRPLTPNNIQFVSSELSRISQTLSFAPIIRASALTRMAQLSDTNSIIAVARGVKSPDEHVRLGAIEGSQNIAGPEKWRVLTPLLKDDVLAVRGNAAFALASLWGNLSREQQNMLTPALNDYIAMQKFNEERSFAHANIGVVHAYQGNFDKAITSFNTGIRIEPYFAPTYLNLSKAYRQLGNEKEAIASLHKGIRENPDNAQLHYELGLGYVRTKDMRKASEFLEKATQLAPYNSQYFYVYGLSLESINQQKASDTLYDAFALSNNPQHLYAACDLLLKHGLPKSNECLIDLAKFAPQEVINRLRTQYQVN
jgi:predicted CXXCH cytochrome family protein